MEIKKANWTTSGNNLKISVPFSKVDKSKRTVSGFATLDNIDTQGDIVEAEASISAFKRFRGNIREMHQPLAVGKVVSFEPKSYYDPADGKVYNGVYVNAYVSKGAQDTWEKVLDGTLQGFSIGGAINKTDVMPMEGTDSVVRIIKDYDLVELSLVDNPANQLANIFSIEKSNGLSFVKGLAADVTPENIFWCKSDSIAVTSTNESADCENCNCKMDNIGWVESNDVNKAESIKNIVDQYLNKNSEIEEITEERRNANDGVLKSNTANEGGTNMADEAVVETVETTEAAPAAEAPVADAAEAVAETAAAVDEAPEGAEAVVEKAADIQEVAVEELDFSKKLDELKAFFADNFAKNAADNAAATDAVRSNLEEVVKSAEAKLDELTKKHEELSLTVKSIQDSFASTEKRIDAVESETAVKKSADLGGSADETVTKSKWGGTFLGVRDIL